TWWSGGSMPGAPDPVAYGPGIALRIRGGGDPDGSALLAESRFFLRVMASRWNQDDPAARSMPPTPAPTPMTDRTFTVLIGIGASWGAGTPNYTDRFRLRPFHPTILW